MRKVSDDSANAFGELQERVSGIFAEENINKTEAFQEMVDSLQNEALGNVRKMEENGYAPTPQTEKNERSIVERLNFVAEKAFDNNLSAALPCKNGHAGTKDEFYARSKDVIYDSGEKVSWEGSQPIVALRAGEKQAKDEQAYLNKCKLKSEASIARNEELAKVLSGKGR